MPRWGWLVVALGFGCGFRTEVGGLADDDDPVFTTESSCESPIELLTTDSDASGNFDGVSRYRGVCGSDGGREHVYAFVPIEDTDVVIEMTASAAASLRVYQGACQANVGLSCERVETTASTTFWASAGETYYVVVDAAQPEPLSYEFQVRLGPPDGDQCSVHPETIVQQQGSLFQWGNEFASGHGEIASQCGAPGRENMFPLDIVTPGRMIATAVGTGGFEPVLSVRRGCGASTELECTPDRGGASELEFTFTEPGRYFLVVDSASIDEGGYDLFVEFPG